MAGLGTILVVARQLGRRAEGIEVSDRYCELAATRLAPEMLGITFSGASMCPRYVPACVPSGSQAADLGERQKEFLGGDTSGDIYGDIRGAH